MHGPDQAPTVLPDEASVSLDRVVVCQTNAWVIEHEPESDAYFLIDGAGCYCAELHWNEDGDCWADFVPYVAFAGPTTVADIMALQALADLLLAMAEPRERVAEGFSALADSGGAANRTA